MSQITTGIRSILSSPSVYDTLQKLIAPGRKQKTQAFVDRLVGARPGDRVLDLGSGTSSILEYLPGVDYHGFDISAPYIEAARAKFGDRGTFEARMLTEEAAAKMQPFDICLSLGVLHHLDDEAATALFRTAYAALQPGGRLLTMDPCYADGQNPIARFIISMDRGQNIRTREQYLALACSVFPDVHAKVKHRAWIPYTHCFMNCIRHS